MRIDELPERVDVLIAGGGPAGLATARAVAGRAPGRSVLVVHRDAHIGLPVRTSGGSWALRLRELGIPSHLQHPIRTLVFASPGAEARTDFGADHPVVLDVTGTYRHLADLATRAGARVMTGATVSALGAEPGATPAVRVSTAAGARTVRAEFVVDATGVARSLLPAWGHGPRFARLGVGAEYEFEDASEDRGRAVLFVGSRFAPSGYGWVFPTPGGKVRVGVGVIRPDSRAHPGPLLDAFMASGEPERMGLKLGPLVERHHGVIPADDAPGTCVHGPLVAVGDSACQALPLVGEGIRYAVECGGVAGEALARALAEPARAADHLAAYDRWWSARYRGVFERAQRANRAMARFDDAQWGIASGFLGGLSGDDLAAALRMELSPLGWLRAALRRPISLMRFVARCRRSG